MDQDADNPGDADDDGEDDDEEEGDEGYGNPSGSEMSKTHNLFTH